MLRAREARDIAHMRGDGGAQELAKARDRQQPLLGIDLAVKLGNTLIELSHFRFECLELIKLYACFELQIVRIPAQFGCIIDALPQLLTLLFSELAPR